MGPIHLTLLVKLQLRLLPPHRYTDSLPHDPTLRPTEAGRWFGIKRHRLDSDYIMS